ncbi:MULTISPECIES: hypothetical protein [unclassified Nonomuraea]
MEQYTPLATAAGAITGSAGAAPTAKPHDQPQRMVPRGFRMSLEID